MTDVATESLDRKEHEPRHIIAHMTDAIHRFVGNADQSDDLTMMAIQFTNNASGQTS